MADPSLRASSNTDRLVGRVINDRFEIVDLIARGGMGRVYRARQRPLGRLVALKILDPRYKGEEDPDFHSRFFLEAATAAKLSHPNTVTVFDFGKTDDDIYFIVMELVEGRTLSALLKELGPIEPERAINIAVQIARSLREAHALGVVHRDLKPANVLLTRHGDEDDFVKVLDFGLVKDAEGSEELTQAGLFMGSPKYMSPEQIQGANVDGRTDIYALGVILYQMLCGRVPFDRDNQVQILMAHVREGVPPMVRDDGVAVPQGLASVAMTCLAKDPGQRFADMSEVAAVLRSVGDQLGNPLPSTYPNVLSGAFELGSLRPTEDPAPSLPSTASISYFPSSIANDGLVSASDSHSKLGRAQPSEGAKGGSGKWIATLLAVALGVGAGVAYLRAPPFAGREGTVQPGATLATSTETGQPGARNHDGVGVSPPREAPLASVVVELRSEPPGATVLLAGRTLGTTPTQRELVGADAARGRELHFSFQKEGYVVQHSVRVVTGEPNILVEVFLERTPALRRPPLPVGERATPPVLAPTTPPATAPVTSPATPSEEDAAAVPPAGDLAFPG